jgi:hypothetical protein
VRGLERETLMLNSENLLHGLQSWCFGIMLRHRVFRAKYRCGESSFPNLFIKAHIGCCFFKGLAYEKPKWRLDVEVRVNLDFVH